MVAELVNPMDRGLEPQRKPHRAEERARRRRAAFVARFSRAKTPGDKLDVAVDYFRATAKDHSIDQAAATTAMDQQARALIDRADQLTKTLRRNR